ncbi:MAG TPA: DinB family protein [Thermoanaerobaculia bacterium]
MFLDLYRHMAWADATVWRVALATPECQGDEKLKTLLHHVHMVQRAFFSVWTQTQPEYPEASEFPDLLSIAAWGREIHQKLAPFVDAIHDDQLDDPVILPWAKRLTERFGQPEATRFRETLLQIPMHSQYHRGQANIRLRELGAEPPLVDYIAWVWFGRPPASWPG